MKKMNHKFDGFDDKIVTFIVKFKYKPTTVKIANMFIFNNVSEEVLKDVLKNEFKGIYKVTIKSKNDGSGPVNHAYGFLHFKNKSNSEKAVKMKNDYV